MGLENRVYSILVVSAAETLNTALYELLPESFYNPIRIVPSISSAKRALAEREFDFIIVNSPLPDDIGTRFAIDACRSKNCVVLILVRAELHGEIYEKVYRHGVFTLSKPTSKAMLSTALGWMASARERLRTSEKKNISIEEKMEEIRLVNRAKWIIINQFKMDEPSAHHYIEKQAMDRCISKREAAKEIINTYS